MGYSSSDSEQKRKKSKKKKEKKAKKSKKEKKSKKDKKHKHRKRSPSSSGSSGSGSDEWVEALPAQSHPKQDQEPAKLEREDWMNSMLISTYSREPKKEEKKNVAGDAYDPKTSIRELNPYWKNGGSGLPSFRKPAYDDEENAGEPFGSRREYKDRSTPQNRAANSGGWKKSIKEEPQARQITAEQSTDVEKRLNIVATSKTVPSAGQPELLLTDEQLNELGAKIIKAELLGNNAEAGSLKEKLEKAKALRSEMQLKKQSDVGRATVTKRKSSTEESVTYTVSKSHDETQRHSMRKQKRYQQNLPQGPALVDKFRSERHENDSMDAQFFKVSAKMGEGKRLENIFDHQKASSSVGEIGVDEERTVREMNRMSKAQADCDRCISSGRFCQDQLVAMGKGVYLSIPTWRALQPKHCFIVPVDHYPSLTQVDENVYQEIVEVCKALVQMFRKHQLEVVFFETVRYLNRNPHTYIQCVPASNYEMAPFYFKKAILESETEWAMNKKLHNVDGFNVKRTVPKNLPYFWVNFNMENGFAHVIEDQESFPVTFATETIAGILGLDTRDWRKPRKETNPAQKVEEFKNWWREFDAVLQRE